jgi:hypothetical protein
MFVKDASPAELQGLLKGRPPHRRAPAPAAVNPSASACASFATSSGGGPCKRPHVCCSADNALEQAGDAAGCDDVSSGGGSGAAIAPWQDLPAHVIAAVALGLGGSVGQIMPLMSTCRWEWGALEGQSGAPQPQALAVQPLSPRSLCTCSSQHLAALLCARAVPCLSLPAAARATPTPPDPLSQATLPSGFPAPRPSITPGPGGRLS